MINDQQVLAQLNSATKYPSILTYHGLNPKDGRLVEAEVTEFPEQVTLTEKINGCVPSLTRVSMADGTRKEIAKIHIGEEVLGVDEHGYLTATPVLATFNNGHADEWMRVRGPRPNAGRGSSFFAVTCTPNHRFWLPNQGSYRTADELTVGDQVTMIRSELELSPVQSSVLLGKLLGDGSLQVTASGSAAVVFSHKTADAGYVRWTLRALGDIASPHTREQVSGYGTPMTVAHSAFHPAIAQQFANLAPKGKTTPEWVADALDPIALAFWYMDDGSLSHNEGQEDRATIATSAFPEEGCAILLRGLRRLGIEGTLMKDNSGFLIIRFNAVAAERLFLLIAPYVPPSMQRKLPERYRGHDGWLPPAKATFRELLVDQTISEIKRNVKNVSSSRYDIATGTHNFFANGVLVHNSNGRIVITPDGDWFIGSREELLYAAGDRIENPALSIVSTLKPLANRIKQLSRSFSAGQGITWVYFLEVYGHGIGPGAKQYTAAPGVTGYRLFDIAGVNAEVLDWEREKIASWRQHGGQQFLSEAVLQTTAEAEEIPLVPRLGTRESAELPRGLEAMQEFLHAIMPGGTRAALDDSGGGAAEGIVLRSADRSMIAKARFEDYARTLRQPREKKEKQ